MCGQEILAGAWGRRTGSIHAEKQHFWKLCGRMEQWKAGWVGCYGKRGWEHNMKYLCLKIFILFWSAEKRLEGEEAQSGSLIRDYGSSVGQWWWYFGLRRWRWRHSHWGWNETYLGGNRNGLDDGLYMEMEEQGRLKRTPEFSSLSNYLEGGANHFSEWPRGPREFCGGCLRSEGGQVELIQVAAMDPWWRFLRPDCGLFQSWARSLKEESKENLQRWDLAHGEQSEF